MKISVISQKGNLFRAFVEESTPEEMNLLRREIMFEVPVMAIEDIYITKNESPLYDEILAQRLGLVPLSTDLLTYKMPNACSCKETGCASCQVKLSASISGPATFYARDLRTTDPKVKPLYPDMVISKLGKNQQISFEAVAVLGKGAEHVKWSPALVYYIYNPTVKIDSKKIGQKEAKEASELCQSGALENKAGKLVLNEEILKSNPLAIDQVKFAAEKFDGISIEEDSTKFIFTIESWGQLNPAELLRKASEAISEQLSELKLK